MGELVGLSTLNCIYFFLFALGVGYAIVAAVMGGLSHVDVPGVDIDIPGVDLHPGEPDIHFELPFAHDVAHDALAATSVRSSPETHLSAHLFQSKSEQTCLAQAIANSTRCSAVISGKGITLIVLNRVHPTFKSPSRLPISPSASQRTGLEKLL